MSAALATRIAEDFAAAAHASGDLQRQRAMQALTERGLPTSRDENWKYVNLRPLEKVRFTPATGEPQAPVTAQDLPAPVAHYSRYTFIDGVFAPALSAPTPNAGVLVKSMKAAAAARANPISTPDLRFALLNEAFATDGAQILVEPGTDCQTCVELVFVAATEGKAGASYPRVSFHVGAGAQVGLIERHVSIGSDANFINCAVDVSVARDASVKHYRVQQTGARAIWFDTLTARLAENARYQLHSASLGALSARSTVHVQLAGERSEVGLFNVSVGGKNQVHDTFALVEHIAANARTEQSFRGISAGRARVAFNGKIIVRKGAHGTDSRQSLRGLLAGADAEIDVRPQLEIYTDDVRCNHGATAGKLDDNMLFYLLSRGLDRETAQRLLKWAFLEDVVAKIEVPELRRQIEQSLAGQLNETAALKELL
ncbi:MAG TPA: Fe-S cluster assembly protein SufD [Steroidobacteraceae bacterium]|nr:Fe-S cluster assembly protein SufD [Steroidobacteraceae bacterium]